jgi:hypothetical protein
MKENPAGSAPQMRDSTSNTNHETSSGSMTSGDQVAGKVNGSLDLDGSDDKLTITDNGTLNISGELTASAWIKSADTKGGILSKIALNQSSGWIFALGRDYGPGYILTSNWDRLLRMGMLLTSNWDRLLPMGML